MILFRMANSQSEICRTPERTGCRKTTVAPPTQASRFMPVNFKMDGGLRRHDGERQWTILFRADNFFTRHSEEDGLQTRPAISA
jgi:hypothetical protein